MVTKEAKIGLLLGLGFIIAIAVVLRDVHETGKAELQETLEITDNQVNKAPPSALPLAVEQLSSPEDQGFQPAPAPSRPAPPNRRPVTNPRPNRPQRARPAQPRPIQQPVSRPGPIAGNNRPEMQPASAQNQIPENQDTQPHTDQRQIRYEMDLPTAPPPAQTEPDSVIVPPSGVFEKAVDKVVQRPSLENNIVRPPQILKPKTYVVSEGDSLSKIALNFYGPVEGNRLVNIQRIYDANCNTLSSMDELRVGQKLIIPQLDSRPGEAEREPSDRRSGQTTQETPPRINPKYTIYIVKEGDSLWRIARQQLGDGSRFPEIARLNDRVISDEHSVYPGMRLKVPAK
ncbi:MAG: LysM peptidoglycan-binding domain-containing protein [Sedimentisphaerales bacterium]|nr:LysM peptidoglycan-binding domain-containing protein [Sedimentisphaerales bacterium]